MEEEIRKPGRPAKVEVEVIRAIGVDADPSEKDGKGRLLYPGGVRTAKPGEMVKLEREVAKKLQAVGAVRVVL